MMALLFSFSFPVHAEPRYAIHEGVACSSCHVNITGAGKRNDTGGLDYWSQMQKLVMRFSEHLVPKEVTGRLTPFAAVGADFRVQNRSLLADPLTNETTIPWASLYAEINAGKHLTGYADYDVANTVGREIFMMAHKLTSLNLHIKGGKINLPYGLRLEDDTSPIRSDLGLSYANQDLGLEAGIAPGPFEFVAAVSNGVPGGFGDENLAKALTTSATWIGEKGRVGASFQWNKRTANILLTGGFHGGLKIWDLVWLGEVDLRRIESRAGGGTTYVMVGYGEMDYEITQGLFAKASYDYRDPDYEAVGNIEHRVGVGFDIFPLPFSELSLLYRMNVGGGVAGDDELIAQFHFFF